MRKKNQKQSKPRKSATKTSPSSTAIIIAPPPERPWQLNSEEITIVKNSIAKGASDKELEYCLTVARRYKLDPFKRQIWFVPRWDSSADNGSGGKGAMVWTPQVGIDGLLFMSARDHNGDFGSVSEPEFGPMIEASKTVKAPEWARVRVFKKGMTEPTVATVYWEEYAPDVEAKTQYGSYKAPFWRKMPRRMLGKCASALALRQAYPDLGGLYIPEECERMNEDITPSGRQIIQPNTTKEAQKQVMEAKNADLEAKIAAQRARKPPKEAKCATFTPDLDSKAETGIPKATAPPEHHWKGTVEFDWSESETAPIIRGDIGELLDEFKAKCTMAWVLDWWHVLPKDYETVSTICADKGYLFKEIAPLTDSQREAKKNSGQKEDQKSETHATAGASTSRARDTHAGAEPVIVKGMIEQVVEKMTKGKRGDPDKGIHNRPAVPYLSVLIKTEKGSQWCSLFDKDLFHYVNKGKIKKEGEFAVQKSGEFWNLVGFSRIETIHFDSDHKTEVIQQRDREAGNRSLFGT